MPPSSTPIVRTGARAPAQLSGSDRAWARWRSSSLAYTVGVEEEVMLVDAQNHRLAYGADSALEAFSEELRTHLAPETHACVLELRTGAHPTVTGALRELRRTRSALTCELAPLGMQAACAGTHALASHAGSSNSDAPRYQRVAETMRSLAHREATMALHVHVGIPRAEDAVRVFNRLRENIPVFIALSANSPFVNGSDTGFDSARTTIFGGFPRTGAPRTFRSYMHYVNAVDALIAPGAIADPTFLWWDVRLQPTLGTVEVRAMDAQTALDEAAPLIALVQSLARLELEGAPLTHSTAPEVLEENRFLAARDGVEARLIDGAGQRLEPLPVLVTRLIEECRPHAAELRCAAALENLSQLLSANGASHQRACASRHGLSSVVPAIADEFTRQSSRW
ncbi:MAG: YbdK family carboxylate-amine ligase [Solirubrobacteraceae bacterium]